MRLSEIIARLDPDAREVRPNGTQGADPEVTSVVTDSREAVPGAIFCALPGEHADGADFIADAHARGAIAAITERAGVTPLRQLVVPDARAAMRTAAWALWEDDARAMRLAAVTGTNGKTTVVTLLRDMLVSGGASAGLVGTLGRDLGAGLEPTGFTTPETAELLEAISRMRRGGMRWGVIEVSSQALALGRVFPGDAAGGRGKGLDFEVAVFTNLTPEHLDFHGTMEAYLDAKAILFESLSSDARAVLNREDPSSRELARRTGARVLWTGLGESCDVRVEETARGPGAKRVRLVAKGEAVELAWTRPGRHNLVNLASAAGGATAAGISLEDIARAAEAFGGVPGRLDVVDAGQPFKVLVDYAHTPDALETILGSLRPETEGRLICVFGCGGDRDPSKRPLMGGIAERLADMVVVTSDNPRSEDPAKIIDEVIAGMTGPSRAHVEPDRERAIRHAVRVAREGDTLLIAGKGHETEQIVGDERHPFDDRIVARAAIEALAGNPRK